CASVQRPSPATDSSLQTTLRGAGAAASPNAITGSLKVAWTLSIVATVPDGEKCVICAAFADTVANDSATANKPTLLMGSPCSSALDTMQCTQSFNPNEGKV